ncbi:MAG: uroporphyrinogen-III synthase, partial [Pseudomonadota bacterium]
LADAVAAAGGQAIVMPAMDTRAVDAGEVVAALGNLPEVELVIFISPAAVTHGAWLLMDGRVRAHRVAAIGASTASKLTRAGMSVQLMPEGSGYTSEDLLRHPALTGAALHGAHALIVRGRGGRELLASTLRERGSHVDYAEVYERVRPPSTNAADTRAALRRDGAPHIITATSVEILDNALIMLGDEADWVRRRSRVLAPSERIAQAGAATGFMETALRSQGADNEALLRAMEEWWPHRR